LLGLRVIHGIGLAICFTAIFTFIVDLIPVDRLNEGIGMFGTSGLIGMAVGPLVAEPILENYGFSAFFFTAAGLAAAALILQAPIKDRHHLQDKKPAKSPSFFALLKTRKQLVCGGLAVLFGFGLAATGSFIAPFAESRNLGYISLYYLAYSTAAVGVRFVAGKMADRLGENQIIPWGLSLVAGGLLLVPLVHGIFLLLVAGFIFGTGHGLLFPALNAMGVRDEAYEVRGKVTGIFTGGIDAGIFCGALILGSIGKLAGFTALFICSGLMVLCGLWLFQLRPARATKAGH
jgi:predicted MFS family arabinose efflux permease